ncbi:glutaredoxin family protein [Ornithinibacillus sp. 4-3]|uniref:Glutaredoxin family protein n=1 Tax=Ornithinibacillus sp. 4-3 TaxID=3231488 RepID=A0AB39HLW1_9BACI
MEQNKVVVYVSDHCSTSEQLVAYLDKHKISYEVRNVTSNYAYLLELQEKGMYGTPVTYFAEQNQFVLGFPKDKIADMLGINF